MGMDEPLRSGRNEILSPGAKRIERDDYTLITVARGEAPADSDVDLLVDMEEGSDLLDRLGCQLSGKGF